MKAQKSLLAKLFNAACKDDIRPAQSYEISSIGYGIKAGAESCGYGGIEPFDF
jgi:hypothetical protein